MSSPFYISLKLADRSFYPLFRPGEWGEKTLNLAAAKEGQEKLELRFFLDSENEEASPLLEILLDKSQIPGEEWTDLLLKMKVSREEGFVVSLHSKGEQIEVQQRALPFEDEEDSLSDAIEKKQDKGFSISFSLISAAVLFCLSLAGAFFMGNILSSSPPPDLSTELHQEPVEIIR